MKVFDSPDACHRYSGAGVDLSELAAGLRDLDSEDGAKDRIVKIDPEFIRKAKAEDPNVTMEQLVQMKIGVRRVKSTN